MIIDPLIDSYKQSSQTRVGTKNTPDSVTPTDVAGCDQDLAEIVRIVGNAVNNFDLLGNTLPPLNSAGVDDDIYIQGGTTLRFYKKISGVWSLKVSVPLGVTIQNGNINLQPRVSGFTITVPPGQWGINNQIYTKAAQDQFTINAADANLDRIDAVFAKTDNTVEYVAGTASSNPDTTKPITPVDEIIVTYIYVPSVASGGLPYINDSNSSPTVNPLVLTGGTSAPTGGNDGDVYIQNDGSIVTFYQKVTGTWTAIQNFSIGGGGLPPGGTLGQSIENTGDGEAAWVDVPEKIQEALDGKANYNPSSSGLIIGDSTIAAYACGDEIGIFLFTDADTEAGSEYFNQAVPGNTILQQETIFLADPNRTTYDWTMCQIGLNDLEPSESAATALVRYQNLINTINAEKKPACVVIVSAMIPPKQRLIDVYGPTDGLVAYAKWQAMNEAIMGGGATPITGVDYRIDNHNFYLDDGNGNLKTVYDCGDHIHENNAARQIIATVWRQQLNLSGFLTSQLPYILVEEDIANVNTGTVNKFAFYNEVDEISSSSLLGQSGGKLDLSADIVPTVDGSFSLGSPSQRNRNGYFKELIDLEGPANVIYSGRSTGAFTQAAIGLYNNAGVQGAFVLSGSSFGNELFRNKTVQYSSGDLVLLSDALVSGGGTHKIIFVTAGNSNPIHALELDADSNAKFGAKVSIESEPTDPKDAVRLEDTYAENAAATPPSASDLTTLYGTKPNGFRVFYPALDMQFTKRISGWYRTDTITVT